jgi:uncharacterized protein (TIGR00369 family)
MATTKIVSSERSRNVTWEDPEVTAAAAAEMSGLEYLSAVRDGRLPCPPVWSLVDFRLTEVADDRVVFEMNPAEWHYNRFSMVQGGIACTVLDAAMACALQTGLPRGIHFTTLGMNVNYMRPISSTAGLMRCEGRAIQRGNRIVIVEAKMLDAGGVLYAYAVSTCMLLKPAGAEPPHHLPPEGR